LAEEALTRKPFLKRLWEGTINHRALVLTLLFTIALTVVMVIYRNEILKFKAWGYSGLFIINLLGNATVFFPVPNLAVTFASGSVLNPLLVGLVAGAAEPIGELTSYLAGYYGGAVIEKNPRYAQVRDWTTKRAFLALFVLAAIPDPLFHLAGITAGAIRYPVWKFLLSIWLGKTLKAIVVALLGAGVLGAISRLFVR
jgi:uncharacterized membrane protein YdjX (TVP38/TMEM64 family)